MTDLACKVKNCIFHSSDNYCERDNIKVGGCSATDCKSTCCTNYERGTRDKFFNSCGCGTAKTEISCEAVNCRFNKENRCVSKHIDVKPVKDTGFGDTECASFEMK